MTTASVANRELSFTPQPTQDIPTNPEFRKILTIDNASSVIAKPVTEEADDREAYGAPGDPTVTNPGAPEGDFEINFRPQFSGDDDYLMLAGIYPEGGAFVDIDSTSGNTIDINGVTVNSTTGILDFAGAAATPDQLLTGQCVEIYGDSGGTEVNGVYQLVFSSGTEWIMSPLPPATKTLGAGALMISERARNGSQIMPFIWKDNQKDISSGGLARYNLYCFMAEQEWTFEPSSKVRLRMSLTGKGKELKKNGETYTGETLVTPTAHPIIVTGNDLGRLYVDGISQADACAVLSVNYTFTRDISQSEGVWVEGACDLVAGNVNMTGSLSIAFQDETYIERLDNNTPLSLVNVIPHADGVGYSHSIPRFFINDLSLNEDESRLIQDVEILPAHDSDLGYFFEICRFVRP